MITHTIVPLEADSNSKPTLKRKREALIDEEQKVTMHYLIHFSLHDIYSMIVNEDEINIVSSLRCGFFKVLAIVYSFVEFLC